MSRSLTAPFRVSGSGSGSGLARLTAVCALTLALAGATGLLNAPAAQAQTVSDGSLAFSGDAGDYISGGQSYSYSAASGDGLDVYASTDDNHIAVSVNGANGDWWSLDLAAPSGQALAPGDYTGATRYPFNSASQPGLSLDGNGRGCNTLTGSFSIADVKFGPNGYVEKLDATYEQHCEGGTAALRGEVHIANPAPPTALSLGVSVNPTGAASTLDGKATVGGTVTCNQPVKVSVSGNVTQVAKQILIKGSYATTVACEPGTPAAWTATADPTGTTPFQKGDVEVSTKASATDPNYGQTVTANQTAVVSLSKDKPAS
jgi:heat shock protein HslJ